MRPSFGAAVGHVSVSPASPTFWQWRPTLTGHRRQRRVALDLGASERDRSPTATKGATNGRYDGGTPGGRRRRDLDAQLALRGARLERRDGRRADRDGDDDPAGD